MLQENKNAIINRLAAPSSSVYCLKTGCSTS